jgi:transposase
MLVGLYRLSRRQVQALLAGWEISISLGAIHNVEQRASEGLRAPVEEAARAARSQSVANVDETSWRDNGKKRWLWVLATALATIFMIRRTRGKISAQALLGKDFGGIVISDRFVSYYWIDDSRHQFCWAHLKRDFQAMEESKNAASQDVGRALIKAKKKLFKWWRRVKCGKMKRRQFQLLVEKTLAPEVRKHLKRGSDCGHHKHDGVCREILRHFESLWTFVRLEGVEPTNNLAERSLRPAVIWRKTSFGSGGKEGTGHRFVERVLTTVATLKQHGRDVESYLMSVIEAQTRGATAPSLLPSQP